MKSLLPWSIRPCRSTKVEDRRRANVTAPDLTPDHGHVVAVELNHAMAAPGILERPIRKFGPNQVRVHPVGRRFVRDPPVLVLASVIFDNHGGCTSLKSNSLAFVENKERFDFTGIGSTREEDGFHCLSLLSYRSQSLYCLPSASTPPQIMARSKMYSAIVLDMNGSARNDGVDLKVLSELVLKTSRPSLPSPPKKTRSRSINAVRKKSFYIQKWPVFACFYSTFLI